MKEVMKINAFMKLLLIGHNNGRSLSVRDLFVRNARYYTPKTNFCQEVFCSFFAFLTISSRTKGTVPPRGRE